MKFGKPMCGNAAEMSVEFQSDAMIIILQLAVSRVFFVVRCLKNNRIESMNSLPPKILVTRLLTTCIHRAALCPATQWLEPGAGAIFSSKNAWQFFNLGRF